MKSLIVGLLSLCLATPAFAWRAANGLEALR
jgi:hypothetical protein